MIQVQTFGEFDIRISGNTVLKRGQRANKNLDLLRYFITFKDRKLLPENIIEDLWREDEVVDPKNALRSQVFRLRKCLKGVEYIAVHCEDGSYVLHTDQKCIFDTDAFEEGIRSAEALKEEGDSGSAIEAYRRAIEYYRGDYMAEDLHSECIMPMRNRYHRMFVHAVLNLMELLKTSGKSADIIELYERVFPLEPFEEGIHMYFLEALIGLNHMKHALSHYKYITDEMLREFSVEPSPAMKSIYKRIVRGDDNRYYSDLFFLEERLAEGDDLEEANFCDIDQFKFLYNLERRKGLRMKRGNFLALITVTRPQEEIPKNYREYTMQMLIRVLKKSLRRGDVFCRWNPAQIVILFTDICEKDVDCICKRVQGALGQGGPQHDSYGLKIDFQPMGSSISMIN